MGPWKLWAPAAVPPQGMLTLALKTAHAKGVGDKFKHCDGALQDLQVKAGTCHLPLEDRKESTGVTGP